MDGRRRPAVAGTWYPAEGAALTAAVDGYLAAAAAVPDMAPRAIVVPHAGLRYSGPVAAHAYASAAAARPEAVVLVGPSHFVPFRGVSLWPDGAWETPLGPVPVDEALGRAIRAQSPVVVEHAAAHAREHSLELQLPFIARLFPGVPIVPLVMGDQSRDTCLALGGALAGALGAHDTTRVLLVASSDLSHYEDAATAWRMDQVIVGHLDGFDAAALMATLERDPRHACGGGAIVAVLEAARALGASEARVLHYADSGDVSGDKSAVVGYLAAAAW